MGEAADLHSAEWRKEKDENLMEKHSKQRTQLALKPIDVDQNINDGSTARIQAS
jgi:hypothetical protein